MAVASTTVPPKVAVAKPVPEYSFDDSVPPPKLLNTGTDYVAIAQSLEIYGNWLSAHRPDPVLALRILAPGTTLAVLFSRDLTRLRDHRQRLIEHLRRPGDYTIINATADAFSVRAQEHIFLHETVNTTGKVTSVAPFPEQSTYLMLGVLSGGRWYLAAVDEAQSTVNVEK